MIDTDNPFSKEILNGSSASAYLWWKNVNRGKVIVPPDFNWHLFASQVVSKAYRCAKNNDEKSSLEWAEMAIKIEDFLASSSQDDVIRACEITAMALRAKMICQFGHIAGHYVLDSSIIIKWFYDRLPFSLTELLNREKQWWNLKHEERVNMLKANPTEQFKTVYVRNRLTVIDILGKCGKLSANDELREWLIATKISK